jgi:hypothetical protein
MLLAFGAMSRRAAKDSSISSMPGRYALASASCAWRSAT